MKQALQKSNGIEHELWNLVIKYSRTLAILAMTSCIIVLFIEIVSFTVSRHPEWYSLRATGILHHPSTSLLGPMLQLKIPPYLTSLRLPTYDTFGSNRTHIVCVHE